MCMYVLVQVEVELWYLHRSHSTLFFFKDLFYFKVYICAYDQKGILDPLELELRDSCEPPGMGARAVKTHS